MKWEDIQEQLQTREAHFRAMCRNEEDIKQLQKGIEMSKQKIREIDKRLSVVIVEQPDFSTQKQQDKGSG